MKGKKKEKKFELEGVLNPQPTRMADDKSVSGSGKPAVGDSWIDLVNSLQTSSGSDIKPLLDLQDRYMGLVDEALRHGNVKDWNDRQDLRQMVFFKFWQMLQMPKGTRGAWDPGRSRFSTDPVATMLSKIARSRAIDFHRGRVRGRRKHDAYAEDRSRFGEAVSDYAVAGAGRRTPPVCQRSSRTGACRRGEAPPGAAADPRSPRRWPERPPDRSVDRRECRRGLPAAHRRAQPGPKQNLAGLLTTLFDVRPRRRNTSPNHA